MMGGLVKRQSVPPFAVKPASLKAIKLNTDAMYNQKLKEEKDKKSKKGKQLKAGIKYDTNKDIFSGDVGAGYDDMDDFM